MVLDTHANAHTNSHTYRVQAIPGNVFREVPTKHRGVLSKTVLLSFSNPLHLSLILKLKATKHFKHSVSFPINNAGDEILMICAQLFKCPK